MTAFLWMTRAKERDTNGKGSEIIPWPSIDPQQEFIMIRTLVSLASLWFLAGQWDGICTQGSQ